MANKYLDQTGLEYFWGKVKAFFAPDTNPLAPGTANKGSSSKFARQDHVHPLQTTVSGNAGTATTLKTARTIDGVSFNGSANIIHYGICDSDSTVINKTIACSGFTLGAGAWIAIKFTTGSSAHANMTFNVNSTGNKSVKYRNDNFVNHGTFAPGTVYLFVYDGTNYCFVGDLDTNDQANSYGYIHVVDSSSVSLADIAADGPSADLYIKIGDGLSVQEWASSGGDGLIIDAYRVYPATSTPVMDGTANVGTSNDYARADHVHPSDTTKVDKVSGKGLSTNDYTTTEKNKLAGIASGAEVNQNAFSNVKVGSTTIAADGKTDTLELAAGTNITLTPDATNDKVTITAATISPYTSNPAMDGTASAGSSANYSRGDHVHPTDTSRAALASPTFTGTPKAPTATAGTNTTQIATTAFVTTAVANAQVGAATFQGTVSANSTISDSAYKKGWYWVVATAGTYVGETCEVGDMIFAIKDKGSAYAASDFSVIQSNLDLVAITNSEIDTIVA